MSYINADSGRFLQKGIRESLIPCPSGQSITVTSTGGTLYYKSSSGVTSSSNDGNITTTNSATFTAPQYVICAQGASTVVTYVQTEGVTGNLRVGGNLTTVGTSTNTGATTFTGAVTLTGGIASSGSPTHISTIPIGSVAYGSLGNDATKTANTVYYTSLWVPANKTLTGAAVLNGTTAGTDAVVYYLFNSAGTTVAQTLAAGTTASGTDAFQEIAFTSTYAAVGPGRYWLGWQANGTTTKIRTIAASTYLNFTGSAAKTFGAAASITPPTTFTQNIGPIGYVY